MKTNDGGAAFPTSPDCKYYDSENNLLDAHPGMTLRAWLAGQALTGILANPETISGPIENARFSVIQADALLESLQRRTR